MTIRQQKAIRAVDSGATHHAVAGAFGVTRSAISHRVRRAKRPNPFRMLRWVAPKLEQLSAVPAHRMPAA